MRQLRRRARLASADCADCVVRDAVGTRCPITTRDVAVGDTRLDGRDRDILTLLAAGLKDDAVPRQLGLGVRTTVK